MAPHMTTEIPLTWGQKHHSQGTWWHWNWTRSWRKLWTDLRFLQQENTTNTFHGATVVISHSEYLSMISETQSLAADWRILGNDEFGRIWHK